MGLRNKKNLYFIVIMLLIIFLYFHYFLDPTLRQTQLYLRDISVYQAKLADIEIMNNRFSGALRKKEQLQEELSVIQSKLPEYLDSHDIINLLAGSKTINFHKSSMTFLDPIIHQDFCIIPVRLSINTTNDGLLEFLSYLESISFKPTITNLQMSTISFNDTDRGLIDEENRLKYNLQVEMTINFYMKGKAK
jgi:hypothetical protein